MTMSMAQQQTLEKVLSRAGVDADFRKGLLCSPHQTILDAFGVRVPTAFRLKFVEKGKDVDALVVLPDFQSADGELSERELEVVAGGGDGDGDGGDDDNPW